MLITEPAVIYKCTDFYTPDDEHGIFGADPLAIEWSIENPILSDKDGRYPRLREVAEALLPVYKN